MGKEQESKGKFIVLEGVGGSGKSTQLVYASEHLTSLGRANVITREPGGVPEAERIRKLIFLLKGANIINADHQMALFFAAREFWVSGVVAPNIDKGVDVLCDRTYTSTGAYQGYAEGGNIETIKKMADIVMGNYKPNGIILLDISLETARRRVVRENGESDPYDEKGKDYFKRLIYGYREMASQNWGDVPWYVVNGEKSRAEVAKEVARVLDAIIFSKVPARLP